MAQKVHVAKICYLNNEIFKTRNTIFLLETGFLLTIRFSIKNAIFRLETRFLLGKRDFDKETFLV